MTIAYVGLGSNAGPRMKAIREAMRRLDRLPHTRILRRSRVRETEPWGKTDQPRFLNAVVEVETGLEPAEMLERLLAVERIMGRVRGERWGPRPIDLDLLLWNERRIRRRGLHVPHPRLARREFVLVPLEELCPDRIVPGTGRSVRQLRRALERNES